MVAQATDKLQEVGLPGSATTLSSPGYTIGASSINVGSTANKPTATGFTFAIDRVETVNGVVRRIPGTYCEFKGVVTDGTTISSIVKTYGDAQDYPDGSTTRVYIPVASTRENLLVEWGLAHANQDGTLKNGAVHSAAVLATDVVETAKIKNANITTAKLADDAVTPAKMGLTTSVDANGWTVYDYGTWKEYFKELTLNTTSVPSGGIRPLTGVPNYPVGTTRSNLFLDRTIEMSGNSPFFNQTWENDTLYLFNVTSTTTLPGPINVTLHATDKPA